MTNTDIHHFKGNILVSQFYKQFSRNGSIFGNFDDNQTRRKQPIDT